MRFSNTTAQTFQIVNGKEFLITANGANFTIEKKLFDGTWQAVPSSPLLDGEELFLNTYTEPDSEGKYYIRVTPSVAPSEFTISRT